MLDSDLYMMYAVGGSAIIFGMLGFLLGTLVGAKNSTTVNTDYDKLKAEIATLEDKLKAFVARKKK